MSIYDSLLEEPAQASPYDALLSESQEPERPPERNPYDALLDDAPPEEWTPARIAAHNRQAERLRGLPEGSLDSKPYEGMEILDKIRQSTSPSALARENPYAAFSAVDPKELEAEADKSIGTLAVEALNKPMMPPLPRPEGDSVGAGVVRGVETLAEGMTTPLNVVLMATMGGAPAAVQRVASAAFGTQMAITMPEQVTAALEATTPGEKAERITEAVGTGIMTALSMGHAAGRMPAPKAVRLAERVDADLQRIVNQSPEQTARETEAALVNEAPATIAALREATEQARPATAVEMAAELDKLAVHMRRQKAWQVLLNQAPPETRAFMESIVAKMNRGEQLTKQEADALKEMGDFVEKHADAQRRVELSESPTVSESQTATEQAPSATKEPAQPTTGKGIAQNAESLRINEREVSQTRTEPERSEVQGREDLQQPAPGQAGDQGLRQEAQRGVETEAVTPTGIRNAIVDQERVNRGLPERMEPLRRTFGQAWDEAMSKVESDPLAGTKLVKAIKENLDRPLSDSETALLAHEQVTRQNVFDKLIDEVNNASTEQARVEASAKLAEARELVQEVYDAGQASGTAVSRGLNIRKLLVNEDYTLARMEAQTRAIANEGKPLSVKQLAEVKALYERIAQTEKKLREYEASEAARQSKETLSNVINEQKKEASAATKKGKSIGEFLEEQAAKAKDRIIARRGRLNVTVDPLNVAGLVDEAIIGASYLAKGVVRFSDWSVQMVRDFGERVRPYLNDLYAQAKAIHDASVEAASKKLPDDVRLARNKKAIITRTETLKEKIAAGDATPIERRKPLTDKEKERLQFEYHKAREQFQRMLFQAQLANRGKVAKVFGGAQETLNLSRAIMTGGEFSAVGRQGGIIAFAHPIRAIRAMGSMFSAFRSEANQFRIMEKIRNRKNAQLYAQSKLFLHDERALDLTKMEEKFQSRLAEKVPFIAGSQRAYTTFLNQLRADSFDAMAKSFGRGGEVTLEQAKIISNFINTATGRGKLGTEIGGVRIGLKEHSADALNAAFFAPRLVASRFQFLAMEPILNPKFKVGIRERALVAKEYARFLIGIGAMYGLASLAFDDDSGIEWDWRSSDFGKIRIGKTRIDPLSGLSQVTVLIGRLSTGEVKTLGNEIVTIRGEGARPGAAFKVGTRFLRSKLAPLPSFAVTAVTGQDFRDRPAKILPSELGFPPDSALGQLLVPMTYGDIVQSMQEQGASRGTALALAAMLGLGVKTYVDD